MLRYGIKRALERVAVASGAPGRSLGRHTGDVLVLAYHNVLPDGSPPLGDRSLHLSRRDFADQLDSLRASHDVVSLEDALASAASPAASGRPKAVITFDDAYDGAMTVGVAELRARQLPATVFVAPGFLGGGCFWWDVLSTPDNGLDGTVRAQALDRARGMHAAVIDWARASGVSINDVPSHARCVAEEGLLLALEYDRLSIGSHTWSHPNLTGLDAAELAAEMATSFTWLQQFGDRAIPVISYPYGLADARVQAAARAAGYTAGLMVSGGWTTRATLDPFAVPRLNIPAGVSREGFVVRTSGLVSQA